MQFLRAEFDNVPRASYNGVDDWLVDQPRPTSFFYLLHNKYLISQHKIVTLFVSSMYSTVFSVSVVY